MEKPETYSAKPDTRVYHCEIRILKDGWCMTI